IFDLTNSETMENTNFNVNAWQQPAASAPTIAKSFMAGVFSWMGIALGISALTAYVFGTDKTCNHQCRRKPNAKAIV
ncbi:MAG: hypothetical protein ACKO9Q_16300, partial [Pirellula sp.]